MSSDDQQLTEDISTDALLEALADRRRRILLAELRVHDQPRAIADVVRAVAVRENDGSFAALPAADVDRIRCSLHHVHVPKLVDLELVTYDADRDTIALTERASRLEPRIDRCMERIAEAADVVAQ